MINAVCDISHFQNHVDFSAARADGISAVILKATQGIGYTDPTFPARIEAARKAGLLVGAYHFGTCDSGVAQAEYFLGVVNPDANTVLALDMEKDPAGENMTVMQACDFVTTVQAKTGRWPLFYTFPYWAAALRLGSLALTNPSTPIFECPLWLAEYGPQIHVPMPWVEWTLWQATDGADGPEPHIVAGIGRCDRSQFNGSLDDLKAFWMASLDRAGSGQVPAPPPVV